MKTLYISLTVLAAIILSSCFRSVQKGVADDVIKAFIYTKDDRSYLICHESLFQTTSKSTSGGMTSISGWNDTRISVYDIETGALIVRKEFGDITEDENELILGVSEELIWLYSVDDDKGLYAVDPLSLEISISQEDIINANPSLKDRLAIPEYYGIKQFYGFDEKKGKLILTDDQAIRYLLDPKSLKAEKQAEEIKIPDYDFDDYFTLRHSLHKSFFDFENREAYEKYMNSLVEINLEGDKRKSVSVNDEIINPEISFLDGKMIMERKFGEEDESHYLQSDNDIYFIAHRSSTNNTAKLIISCIQITVPASLGELNTERISLSKQWETGFDNIFFDYSGAQGTDEFDDLYSKGDPDFDFNYFTIRDSKLIMIYGLHAVSIDTNNGNVLWSFRI